MKVTKHKRLSAWGIFITEMSEHEESLLHRRCPSLSPLNLKVCSNNILHTVRHIRWTLTERKVRLDGESSWAGLGAQLKERLLCSDIIKSVSLKTNFSRPDDGSQWVGLHSAEAVTSQSDRSHNNSWKALFVNTDCVHFSVNATLTVFNYLLTYCTWYKVVVHMVFSCVPHIQVSNILHTLQQ